MLSKATILKKQLRKTLEHAYAGRSRSATYFRYALICFDVFTVGFFVATGPMIKVPSILIADVVIGSVILADFLARLWIAPRKLRMLRQPYTIADVLVILSLLLAPFVSQNLAFLRVLRTLRLLHSYHVIRDLRRETDFFRSNEDVIVSSVNLVVFIFLMTGLVFTLQFGDNSSIDGYVSALYFTVSALTTTGFGDITLTGTVGQLLAVFIMVVGVALFVRLLRAIFRPQKITYACRECGLNRHEPDAVHCKHCGHTINIETEGQG